MPQGDSKNGIFQYLIDMRAASLHARVANAQDPC